MINSTTKRVKPQFLLIPTIYTLYEYLNINLTVSLIRSVLSKSVGVKGCASVSFPPQHVGLKRIRADKLFHIGCVEQLVSG